jgi:hypothetical protein
MVLAPIKLAPANHALRLPLHDLHRGIVDSHRLSYR